MSQDKPSLCLLLLGIVAMVLVWACNMPNPKPTGEGPQVDIVSPADGSRVTVGQQVLIQSTARDEVGIDHVELIVDSVPVRTDPPLEDATPTIFSVAQPWFPAAPGDVVVQVVAHNVAGQTSLPASITLHVVSGEVQSTPTSAPTSTPVPDVTAEGGCTLNAAFVDDVTIPDESELQPGVNFVKTWRIRNLGTCDWGTGYQLTFVKGDQLGAPAAVSVPATVSGSTADVSLPMVAPDEPGSYQGYWRVQSDEGKAFGSMIWVLIVVPAPATDTPTPTVTGEPTATYTPTATIAPPDGPSDLTLTVLPSGYVSLVWVDNAADEAGFHILADGGIFKTVGVDAEGWGFHTGAYFCDETVALTVVAYQGDRWSDPSNEVTYTGPPCPPPTVVEGMGVVLEVPAYLDLDTGDVGAYDANDDLLWQSSGGYRIIGMNGVQFADLGVGPTVPSHTACASATLDLGAIYVPTLQAGTRLCFATTEGHLTGLRVDEIQADHDLVISYVTWQGTE